MDILADLKILLIVLLNLCLCSHQVISYPAESEDSKNDNKRESSHLKVIFLVINV